MNDGAAPSAGRATHDPAEPLVLWELVQTAHLAGLLFRDLFATVGLTPTQFGVLACLADGDDLTKAGLARALMIKPQSMDPLIESLIGDGLVRRDGPARRGRAAGIRITPAGIAVLQRIRPEVTAVNAPERLGLDPAAVGLLVDQLRTMRDRLAR